MKASSPHPVKLRVYIGGYAGPSYRVEWVSDHFEYRAYDYGFEERAVEEVRPTEAEWRTFWRAIGQLRIWGWRASYEPDPRHMVMDGTSWKLEIEYRGRRVKSGGSNAFPDRFRGTARAVERLLGGRNFR